MSSQLGEAFIPIRATLDKLDGDLKSARGKVDSSLNAAGKSTDSFGKKLNSVLQGVEAGFGAALGAGVAFKKAFDYSREGAELTQLTESFDLLNRNVFKTPGLLEDMDRAAGGTIKKTDLMAGVMMLTAGASKEMTQQFALSTPKLLEIARASNKLNPSLGDTSFLYESIATGIKRSQPLILDNLGLVIKVGDANEKYAAELGKTVEELTAEEKQMALLNATLEAGDRLIDQVGGSVDSNADAWARLTVRLGEASDGFKQMMGERLEPVVKLLAGDYAKAIEAAIANTEDIGRTYDNSTRGITAFTNANDLARKKLLETAEAVAGHSDNYEDFIANLKNAGIEQNLLDRAMANNMETLQMSAEEFYEVSAAREAMMRAGEAAGRVDQHLTRYITDTTTATEELYEATTTMSDVWNAQPGIISRLNAGFDEMRQRAEAQTEANAWLLETYESIQEGNLLLIDSTGQLIETDGELIAITDEANQIMRDAAIEAGANVKEVIRLDIARGDLTKTEAQAILMEAAVRAEAQRLGQAYAEGRITLQEMDDQMQDFIETLLEVPPDVSTKMSVETAEAHAKIDKLIRKLVNFDGKTYRATAKVTTEGSVPSAGGDSDGKGGTKDAKHATGTGGWLKVPPGFPDDSYTIGLTSDEVYAVIPDGAHVSSLLTQFEGRDRNGRGMDGGTTFNINAHYKYQDEGSLRDDIRLLQMLADA